MSLDKKKKKIFLRILLWVLIPVILYNILLSSFLIRGVWVPLLLNGTGFDLSAESIDFSLFRLQTLSFRRIDLRNKRIKFFFKADSAGTSIRFFPLRVDQVTISGGKGKYTDNGAEIYFRDLKGFYSPEKDKSVFNGSIVFYGQWNGYNISENKLTFKGSFKDLFRLNADFISSRFTLSEGAVAYPGLSLQGKVEFKNPENGFISVLLADSKDNKILHAVWHGSFSGKSSLTTVFGPSAVLDSLTPENGRSSGANMNIKVDINRKKELIDADMTISAAAEKIGPLEKPAVSMSSRFTVNLRNKLLTVLKASVQARSKKQQLLHFSLRRPWELNRSLKSKFPLPPLFDLKAERFPLGLFSPDLKENELTLKTEIRYSETMITAIVSGRSFHRSGKNPPIGISGKIEYQADEIKLTKFELKTLSGKPENLIESDGVCDLKKRTGQLSVVFDLERPDLLLNLPHLRGRGPLKGLFSITGHHQPENGRTSLIANLESGIYTLSASFQGIVSERLKQADRLDIVLSSGKQRLLTVHGKGSWPLSEKGCDLKISDIRKETLDLLPESWTGHLKITDLALSADLNADKDGHYKISAGLDTFRSRLWPNEVRASLSGAGTLSESFVKSDGLRLDASSGGVPLADITLSGNWPFETDEKFQLQLDSRNLDIDSFSKLICLFQAPEMEKQNAVPAAKPAAGSAATVPAPVPAPGKKQRSGTLKINGEGLSYTKDILGSCKGSIFCTEDHFISSEGLSFAVNGGHLFISGRISVLPPYQFNSKLNVKDFELAPVLKLLGQDVSCRIINLETVAESLDIGVFKKYTIQSRADLKNLLFTLSSDQQYYGPLRLLASTIILAGDGLDLPFLTPFIKKQPGILQFKQHMQELRSGKKKLLLQKVHVNYSVKDGTWFVKDGKAAGEYMSLYMKNGSYREADDAFSVNSEICYRSLVLPLIVSGTVAKPKFNIAVMAVQFPIKNAAWLVRSVDQFLDVFKNN